MKGLWGKEKKRKELRPLSIQLHNSGACKSRSGKDRDRWLHPLIRKTYNQISRSEDITGPLESITLMGPPIRLMNQDISVYTKHSSRLGPAAAKTPSQVAPQHCFAHICCSGSGDLERIINIWRKKKRKNIDRYTILYIKRTKVPRHWCPSHLEKWNQTNSF